MRVLLKHSFIRRELIRSYVTITKQKQLGINFVMSMFTTVHFPENSGCTTDELIVCAPSTESAVQGNRARATNHQKRGSEEFTTRSGKVVRVLRLASCAKNAGLNRNVTELRPFCGGQNKSQKRDNNPW